MSAFARTGASIMSKTNYTNHKGGNSFGQLNKTGNIARKPSMNSNASDLSHDTFKEQFQGINRKDFINEANKIMRERMKNKGSTINSKSKFKSVVLMDSKEICLKNYLIGLLKDKRTDINEKERNITKALRASENQLDADYKEFIDFVEDTKKKLKKDDEDYIKVKTDHDDAENEYRKQNSEYKKYSEELERTVKLICLLKSYGSFVYKVLGKKFWFDGIPDVDPRLRNYEEVANLILKKFETLTEDGMKNPIDDEQILILKFKEYEDKVIKKLETKEIADKELSGMKKNINVEIGDLQKREKDFRGEVKRINKEKKELSIDNEKSEPQKNSEMEIYKGYIIELGQATGVIPQKFNKQKKKYFGVYTVYSGNFKCFGSKRKN